MASAMLLVKTSSGCTCMGFGCYRSDYMVKEGV